MHHNYTLCLPWHVMCNEQVHINSVRGAGKGAGRWYFTGMCEGDSGLPPASTVYCVLGVSRSLLRSILNSSLSDL